jgi:hypothetical protein
MPMRRLTLRGRGKLEEQAIVLECLVADQTRKALVFGLAELERRIIITIGNQRSLP